MRIQQVDITEVFFQTKDYTQGMYDSIVRIGLSFPVKVSLEQGKFYCQDGHKRLSAIASMEKLEVYKYALIRIKYGKLGIILMIKNYCISCFLKRLMIK